MSVSAPPLRIATRGSVLALAQAGLVARALDERGVAHTTVIVETAGDRRAPDTAWGEGAFVTAIEEVLVKGDADMAVHSAKDVPTDEDPRLTIAAYLPREEPRDALVLPLGVVATLDSLAAGTVVGTDSPRRTGFVRAKRPDLEVRPLHGNVDTRLRRLDSGEVGALVLAAAGLIRLGRTDRITHLLPVETLPPAPGQGAIAVQVRTSDDDAKRLVAVIDDPVTRAEVEAERAFLAAVGGGCRAPVGALARVGQASVELTGGAATVDGRVRVLEHAAGSVEDRAEVAQRLAQAVVEQRARSLRGPVVLLTRAASESNRLAGRLAQLGVASAIVPAIAIEAIDVRLPELAAYDLVVVTSANAVRAAAVTGTDFGDTRWAAVGAATARELTTRGATRVWTPSEANGAALARELPLVAGARLLRLRGELADDSMSEALRERGASVDDLTVYRTVVAPGASRPALQEALADSRGIGAIVVASPSAARGLIDLADEAAADDLVGIPVVAIGPTTARAAIEAGFVDVSTARAADADSVAENVARRIQRP